MIKRTYLTLGLAILGLAAHSTSAALRINEIRIDNFGSDTDEYAEIKGNPGESLDGVWYLQIGDHSGTDATKGSGVVEFAVDLTGEVIPDGGYYLIGNTTMTLIDPAQVDWYIGENSFENSDNITHLLVQGYTGTEVTSQADQLGELAVDIDSGDVSGDVADDGVPNVTLPWTSIIDAVGLVETPDAGEWFYGAALGFLDIGPDGNFAVAQAFRFEDTGEWQIGSIDFDDMTDTVKAANPTAPTEPVVESFSNNYPTVGDTLTVTGINFTGATSVTIAGIEATFSVIDATTIEATVPAGGDYGPVVVTTPGGTATSFLNIIILDSDVVLALEENFDEADSLGSFTAFSVSSGLDWTWGIFSGDGYVSMNGYANGAEPASDDWLVSSAIDLTGLYDTGLHFQTSANFSGPDLEVYISTDYDGASAPNVSGTWVPITGFTLSDGGYELTDSGIIDLIGYDDQMVYIAFRYTSLGSGSGEGKIYQVSQVLVVGSPADVANDNPFVDLPHVDGWVTAEITGPDGVMWLHDANWPLVYSLKHGWLYVDATALPQISLYNYEDGGLWITTAIGLYPYMYFPATSQWAWFDIGSQFGSRKFYIFTDDIGWITVPSGDN